MAFLKIYFFCFVFQSYRIHADICIHITSSINESASWNPYTTDKTNFMLHLLSTAANRKLLNLVPQILLSNSKGIFLKEESCLLWKQTESWLIIRIYYYNNITGIWFVQYNWIKFRVVPVHLIKLLQNELWTVFSYNWESCYLPLFCVSKQVLIFQY